MQSPFQGSVLLLLEGAYCCLHRAATRLLFREGPPVSHSPQSRRPHDHRAVRKPPLLPTSLNPDGHSCGRAAVVMPPRRAYLVTDSDDDIMIPSSPEELLVV